MGTIVQDTPMTNPRQKRKIDMKIGFKLRIWSRQSTIIQQSHNIMVLFSLFSTLRIFTQSKEPIRAPTGKAVVHKERQKLLLSFCASFDDIRLCWMEDARIVVTTREYPNAKDPIVIPRLHKYIVVTFLSFGYIIALSSLSSLSCYISLLSPAIQLSFIDILLSNILLISLINRIYLLMGAEIPKINLTNSTIYQGQLQDNKPHGQGKVTFLSKDKGQWIFEGKFSNGQPISGQMKIGMLTYSGQISQRTPQGNGKLIDQSTKTIYQGKFTKGKLVEGIVTKSLDYYCKGKFETEPNGSPSNQIMEEVLHGDQAIYKCNESNQEWSGSFWKGNISGKGRYILSNKCQYVGNFYSGNYTDEGVLTQQSEIVKKIQGNFQNSKPKQFKPIEFSDGSKFFGELKNDLFQGPQCEYHFRDGTIYKGNINQHNFSGECEILYPSTSPIEIYKGEIHEGKYNGLGIVEYRNGVIIKGYFNENSKNGPCILVYGDRMFKGLFMMDRLIGSLQQVPKDL